MIVARDDDSDSRHRFGVANYALPNCYSEINMREALPLVSIITPTYNHEAYIAECIDSVLAQTYHNWEMIVVDDGSTDSTRDVVAQYDDPRIRIIEQANKGIARLSETYNAALSASNGQLIAILEGDDHWPIYKLEAQVPSFCEERVVLSSGFTAMIEDGWCLGVTPIIPPSSLDSQNVPLGAAAKVMVNPKTLTYTFPVSTMVRRTALDRIGGFHQPEYLPLVDFPTFLMLTTAGEFRFLPDVLGFWRRHAGSTTRSRFPLILDGVYRYTAEFMEAYAPSLAISEADLDNLSNLWQKFESGRCSLRGRLLSTEGKYALAIKAFQETALFDRSRANRIATALAIALSTLHLPCEWLFRLMGRSSVKRVVALTGGDVLVAESDLERVRHSYRFGTKAKAPVDS